MPGGENRTVPAVPRITISDARGRKRQRRRKNVAEEPEGLDVTEQEALFVSYREDRLGDGRNMTGIVSYVRHFSSGSTLGIFQRWPDA